MIFDKNIKFLEKNKKGGRFALLIEEINYYVLHCSGEIKKLKQKKLVRILAMSLRWKIRYFS